MSIYEQEIYPGIHLHRRAWIGLNNMRADSRKKVEAEIESLAREDVRATATPLEASSDSESLYMIPAVSNGDQFDIFFTVTPKGDIVVLDLLNHQAYLRLAAMQKQ
jgi:hypothetical protein